LGSAVLVGGQDDIRLYDARGALLRTWSSTSAVNELASSPDGATFASGHHTGEVYLWRPDQDEPVASFIGHASRVNALAFSPDGRTLYSGSWDLTVRAWDISVIQAEARPLQTAIETAWGRDLNDVLSGVY
jgi:WD40 repeat protein